MAVQVRCPECEARLRLEEPPEEGTEIECPRCGTAFPWRSVSRSDGGVNNRPVAAAAAANSPATQTRPKKKKRDTDAPPRKIRIKKKKTNPAILAAAATGGVVFVLTVSLLLYWFFSRKSVAEEMIAYLPTQCDEVYGINYGHISRYPKFFENCEQAMGGYGFRRAMDALSKALGEQPVNCIDYVVQGYGRSGSKTLEATVFRTSIEVSPAVLEKLPEKKKYTAAGVDYYTINDPGLRYPGCRVFAPTPRLVVFARGDMGEDVFQNMLKGHRDNPDQTAFGRARPLAKEAARGTVWRYTIYGGAIPRMQPPPKQEGSTIGGSNDENDLRREIAEILNNAKGYGIRASVGSRDVRGEWLVWYGNPETAKNQANKWKNQGWVKDDEQSPPRWWKTLAFKSGGGNTAPNVLRDNLAFRASGELFIVRSAIEVRLIQSSVSAIVANFTGDGGGQFVPGMPGGGPPGGPPGGMPGGPPGG